MTGMTLVVLMWFRAGVTVATTPCRLPSASSTASSSAHRTLRTTIVAWPVDCAASIATSRMVAPASHACCPPASMVVALPAPFEPCAESSPTLAPRRALSPDGQMGVANHRPSLRGRARRKPARYSRTEGTRPSGTPAARKIRSSVMRASRTEIDIVFTSLTAAALMAKAPAG